MKYVIPATILGVSLIVAAWMLTKAPAAPVNDPAPVKTCVSQADGKIIYALCPH